MAARIALLLLLLTAGTIAVLYILDVRFEIGEEEAVKRELRQAATTEELDARITGALDQGDVEGAEMYAEIADYMGRTLPPETQARLARATSTAATVVRTTGEFASGFVTGEGLTTGELAGAVTSDLTVVGDIRDIAHEGAKLAAGEEYNRFILGLSVVGLGATAATVATGGGGLPAKLAVSVLKVAKRAGTLTAEFGTRLTRLLERAVDYPQLARMARSTDLTNLRATEEAFSGYARTVREAEIFPVLAKIGRVGEAAGPGEAVRLMRYVRTTEDLEDIAGMSAKLGRKTRGVIELTGRTSLRAFKTSLNILEFLIENILAFLAWLGGVLGLGAARRFGRRLRSA